MGLRFTCLGALIGLSLAGCGDGGAGVDAAPIMLFDAAPIVADAAPQPDASLCLAPCRDSCCGDVCTDTSGDVANCGGCGLACDTGEVCESSDCGCAEAFVSANPVFAYKQFLGSSVTGFDGIVALGGLAAGTQYNAFGVAVGSAGVEIGVPYELDGVTGPYVIAFYKLSQDPEHFADAAYTVSSGTVTFTEVCENRYVGDVTDAVFTAGEVALPPVLLAGSCMFERPSIHFVIGDNPCPVND
jgi:hypothetical protein